jgi:hypothetical protein
MCGAEEAYLVHLVVELGVVLVDLDLFRVYEVPERAALVRVIRAVYDGR